MVRAAAGKISPLAPSRPKVTHPTTRDQDSILEELTLAKCTAATVAKLQRLLGESTVEADQVKNSSKPAKNAGQKPSTKTIDQVTGLLSDLKLHAGSDRVGPQPSQTESSVLATKVVNVVLRTLTEAVRGPKPGEQHTPLKPAVTTTKRQPLQARSDNRRDGPRPQSAASTKPAKVSNIVEKSPAAFLIEAADVAFTRLRNGQSAEKCLEIDNAVSAMISKALALGEYRSAEVLLLGISSRLHDLVGTRNAAPKLLDLFHSDLAGLSASIKVLLLTCQQQGLTLVSAGFLGVDDDLVSVLRPEHKASPFALIFENSSSTPEQQAAVSKKYAQLSFHLNSLRQSRTPIKVSFDLLLLAQSAHVQSLSCAGHDFKEHDLTCLVKAGLGTLFARDAMISTDALRKMISGMTQLFKPIECLLPNTSGLLRGAEHTILQSLAEYIMGTQLEDVCRLMLDLISQSRPEDSMAQGSRSLMWSNICSKTLVNPGTSQDLRQEVLEILLERSSESFDGSRTNLHKFIQNLADIMKVYNAVLSQGQESVTETTLLLYTKLADRATSVADSYCRQLGRVGGTSEQQTTGISDALTPLLSVIKRTAEGLSLSWQKIFDMGGQQRLKLKLLLKRTSTIAGSLLQQNIDDPKAFSTCEKTLLICSKISWAFASMVDDLSLPASIQEKLYMMDLALVSLRSCSNTVQMSARFWQKCSKLIEMYIKYKPVSALDLQVELLTSTTACSALQAFETSNSTTSDSQGDVFSVQEQMLQLKSTLLSLGGNVLESFDQKMGPTWRLNHQRFCEQIARSLLEDVSSQQTDSQKQLFVADFVLATCTNALEAAMVQDRLEYMISVLCHCLKKHETFRTRDVDSLLSTAGLMTTKAKAAKEDAVRLMASLVELISGFLAQDVNHSSIAACIGALKANAESLSTKSSCLNRETVEILSFIAEYMRYRGFFSWSADILSLITLSPLVATEKQTQIIAELLELGKPFDALTRIESIRARTKESSDNTWHLQLFENWAKIEICDGKDTDIRPQQIVSFSKNTDKLHGMAKIEQLETIALVATMSALRLGTLPEALTFARFSLKLCHQIWYGLRTSQGVQEAEVSIAESSSGEKKETATNDTYDGMASSEQWHIAARMWKRFCLVSRIYEDLGCLTECQHYLKQASQVAKAVKSEPLQAMTRILQDRIVLAEGSVILSGSAGLAAVLEWLPVDYRIQSLTNDIRRTALDDDNTETGKAIEQIEALVKESLSSQNLPIKVSQPVPKTARSTKSKGARPKTALPPIGTIVPSATDPAPSSFETISSALRSFFYQSRVPQAGLNQNAINLLSGVVQAGNSKLVYEMLQRQVQLESWLHSIELDPSLNLVPDACVALPAVICQDKEPEEFAAQKVRSKKNEKTLSTTKASVSTLKKPAKPPQASLPWEQLSRQDDPHDMLGISFVERSASFDLYNRSLCYGTLADTSTLSDKPQYQVLSRIHAASILQTKQEFELQSRERFGLPKTLLASVPEPSCENMSLDPTAFKEAYLDILPNSWNLVSISLTQDKTGLILSRLNRDSEPFILMLPLDRQDRDNHAGDISFSYANARSEMEGIVKDANQSAHNSVDLSQKGAKTAWWQTRADLDSKLGLFVQRLQQSWFGGFAGIFDPSKPSAPNLSEFEASMDDLFSKHLPTRQKSAKSTGKNAVKLSPEVLQLFACLNPQSPAEFVQDAILDLWHFVLDLLHFHGESNPYDEVDLDQLTIDTMDIITKHRTSRLSSPAQYEHTILVLDKDLQLFPWESMPCLFNMSVSRLRSLEELRTRILRLKSLEGGSRSSVFSVDASSGGYVINPGGDLQATGETFTAALSPLSNWSSVLSRLPQESEIAATLETKSIYVYIGHGSGGQYIRSKTVRKIEDCAVSLLLGCSSARVQDARDFESYGTPFNYMLASAPAVVGMLWDVTDKDCDRFSLTMLEKWGLIAPSAQTSDENRQQRKEKQRSRSPVKRDRSPVKKGAKTETSPKLAEKQNLAQAVLAGRGACFLRYLNGAAPVIYGIPVYLK